MNNIEEKRERMLSMIADWHQSGKSKKAYCAENGINEATFYYWFSRSKENDTAARGSFITIDKARGKSDVEIIYPNGGKVFIFLNRSRTHMKLLHWEKGGFVLYYKRLESGTFMPPSVKNGELSWSDLVLMVEGIQVVKSIQKRRFSLA